ncbi:hypothetical protein CEXT_490081 [Caerostris extrusa]|uniref:Uncharacterized protein n=1 Tax=Caerostris extrusa TaxID=172846 RepID=A0AAV4R066_CAEEX|nr:hypothetical protein CEXT_490081 [Caerostris extrusa]
MRAKPPTEGEVVFPDATLHHLRENPCVSNDRGEKVITLREKSSFISGSRLPAQITARGVEGIFGRMRPHPAPLIAGIGKLTSRTSEDEQNSLTGGRGRAFPEATLHQLRENAGTSRVSDDRGEKVLVEAVVLRAPITLREKSSFISGNHLPAGGVEEYLGGMRPTSSAANCGDPVSKNTRFPGGVPKRKGFCC